VDEIVPTHRAYGVSDSWQLMLPTVSRDRKMKQAEQGKLKEQELYNLRLLEIGRMMVGAINDSGMNVRNVHLLGYLELCRFLRAAWCINDLAFLEHRGADEVVLVTQEDVDDPESPYGPEDIGAIMDPFDVFPTKEIRLYQDCMVMDGNWISSFMITKQREFYHTTDVQRHYHDEAPRGVWSSMASAGDTISGRTETNMLVLKQRIYDGFGSWLNPNPGIEHPKRRRKRHALQSETEELSMVSLAQRYNEVGTVVALDRQTMTDQRAKIMSNLESRNYKCALIRHASLQMPGFITGAYGVNNL
jgi:hypothetical protein